MSVQKDDFGKRWIQVEVEVPGTPEEVWEAIATGPGISSWFMPVATNEEGAEPCVGGAIICQQDHHVRAIRCHEQARGTSENDRNGEKVFHGSTGLN